mmetsp:Transcript_34253/g.80772  ORF Transcript_34253/g.80772 Transcript_34253/m.80772 type:complete len:303 (+) Transcript_34253:142-1050(+)
MDVVVQFETPVLPYLIRILVELAELRVPHARQYNVACARHEPPRELRLDVGHGVRARELQVDLGRGGEGVQGVEGHGHGHGVGLGQLNGDVVEGVERYRDVTALGANKLRPVLPGEKIEYHRVVAQFVPLPREGCNLRVVCTIACGSLCRWFLPDLVCVLVQAVEEEGKQLLRVVLRVACELRGITCDHALKRAGVQRLLLAPDLREQRRVLLREGAGVAKRVVSVEVMLPLPREEVARERLRVAQTLQRRVHEARVPHVAEAAQPLAVLDLALRLRGVAPVGRLLLAGVLVQRRDDVHACG